MIMTIRRDSILVLTVLLTMSLIACGGADNKGHLVMVQGKSVEVAGDELARRIVSGEFADTSLIFDGSKWVLFREHTTTRALIESTRAARAEAVVESKKAEAIRLYRQAKAMFHQGGEQYWKSQVVFQQATQAFPGFAEAWYWTAEMRLRTLERQYEKDVSGKQVDWEGAQRRALGTAAQAYAEMERALACYKNGQALIEEEAYNRESEMRRIKERADEYRSIQHNPKAVMRLLDP